MFLVLEGTVKSTLPGLIREQNKINRGAMIDAGESWHENSLQKHFQPTAKFAYKHERRRQTTKDIKKNVGLDPGLDLVKDGDSRRFMMVDPQIRATPKRGTLLLSAPSYWAKREAGTPDKADEVVRTTKQDRRGMSEAFTQSAAKRTREYLAGATPKSV